MPRRRIRPLPGLNWPGSARGPAAPAASPLQAAREQRVQPASPPGQPMGLKDISRQFPSTDPVQRIPGAPPMGDEAAPVRPLNLMGGELDPIQAARFRIASATGTGDVTTIGKDAALVGAYLSARGEGKPDVEALVEAQKAQTIAMVSPTTATEAADWIRRPDAGAVDRTPGMQPMGDEQRVVPPVPPPTPQADPVQAARAAQVTPAAAPVPGSPEHLASLTPEQIEQMVRRTMELQQAPGAVPTAAPTAPAAPTLPPREPGTKLEPKAEARAIAGEEAGRERLLQQAREERVRGGYPATTPGPERVVMPITITGQIGRVRQPGGAYQGPPSVLTREERARARERGEATTKEYAAARAGPGISEVGRATIGVPGRPLTPAQEEAARTAGARRATARQAARRRRTEPAAAPRAAGLPTAPRERRAITLGEFQGGYIPRDTSDLTTLRRVLGMAGADTQVADFMRQAFEARRQGRTLVATQAHVNAYRTLYSLNDAWRAMQRHGWNMRNLERPNA